MSAKRTPNQRKSAQFRRDPSHRIHFVHAQDLGTRSQRFQQFQQWVLREGSAQLGHSGLVLACLIGFESITSESDLQLAYEACKEACEWRGDVRIDWVIGNRLEARNLGAISQIAIKRTKKWSDFDDAITLLANSFDNSRHGVNGNQAKTFNWESLLIDSRAWLQETLPPLLFGHVTGAAPLNALNRNTLVREQSRLALAPESTDSIELGPATSRCFENAFEAASLGRKASMLGGGAFLGKLEKALTPPTKGSKASQRASVLENLKRLGAQIDDADEVCSLLYLFALELVVNGTRTKDKLAPKTPYQYVTSFATDFHASASGMRLTGIDQEAYSKIISMTLGNVDSVASYRRAGLKAFHQFLRTWWHVPKLPASVFKVDIDTRVDANVVWPHEIETIDGWLREAGSGRFLSQLRTCFAIAAHTMIRTKELQLLQILNVIDEGSHIVIEIARRIKDGTEKSSEGRRRLRIDHPGALQVIREWLARRIKESNGHTSRYLFGNPSEPSELEKPGKTYFWMNRLLKNVTGDERISVHNLRHSTASFRIEQMLQDDEEIEVNPLDILANEAGHVGGHVTAINYSHLFERGLRHAVDLTIHQIDIDYPTASAWTEVPEPTLRKRVSRSNEKCSLLLWSSISAAADALRFPAAGKDVKTTQAISALNLLRTEQLEFKQLVAILADIACGMSTAETSLRQDVSESLVAASVERVGAFADGHGRSSVALLDHLLVGISALRDPSRKSLGFKADFDRTSQARWRVLSTALARTDKKILRDACNYWSRALHGAYLAVHPGPGWSRMIELIKNSSINTSQMALKWSMPKSKARRELWATNSGVLRFGPELVAKKYSENCSLDPGLSSFGVQRVSFSVANPGQIAITWVSSVLALGDASRLVPEAAEGVQHLDLEAAQAACRTAFGRSLPCLAQSYRGGRPSIWFIIGSDASSLQTDGSANSMTGFHCLMLAAKVWLEVLPLAAEVSV